MPPKPIVFGLTGGICSGKSTASRYIAKHGIPVVDADLIAREVVVPGSPALEALIATFGKQYLTAEGELDRAKLGELVFNDHEARRILDALMLPSIGLRAKQQIDRHKENGHQLICYDAALIIEAGLADQYRPLILTYCEPELQIQRLMKRNSLSREQAEARVKTQMSSQDKLKYADLPVSTDGSLEETETQINNIILALKWTIKGE
jgi:dephospho-CoA kinase